MVELAIASMISATSFWMLVRTLLDRRKLREADPASRSLIVYEWELHKRMESR